MKALGRTIWAFLVRDFQTHISYRLDFALQFLGLFFMVALWYFLARFVQGAGSGILRHTGNVDYFSYVLVGLMVNGYLTVSLHGYAAQIRTEQTSGTLEAMLATPARHGHVVLALSAWSYLLAAIHAAAYLFLGVAVFGVELSPGSLCAMLLSIVVSALALSGIGILSAAFVIYFKKGNPVNYFVTSLAMLFGNVVIPARALPAGVAWISRLVPVSYATEAMRGALLKGQGVRGIAAELGVLLGFAAVLLPSGLAATRFAVRRAKQEGSLVQY